MPLSRRLADLEKNLELLYEKLGAMEKAYSMAADPEIKISIKQRIREEITPQIRQIEAQFWKLSDQEASSSRIDEVDASNAVVEVVQIVERVQQNNANQYPDEVIQLLTEIRNKLNEPGKSSAAKLKAALPLLPPFVSYEMELDTEGLLRQVFPTFSRLFRKAEKEEQNYTSHEQGEIATPVGTQGQIRIQRQIQALQVIIDDAKSNPNFANVRERFLLCKKEISNFLKEAVGKQAALNLALISPHGNTDRSRLLNEATQILNYLIELSQRLNQYEK